MLNPSIAGAEDDDPTVTKCCGFAERLGFETTSRRGAIFDEFDPNYRYHLWRGELSIVNIFGYVATKPKALKRVDDPVGRLNDVYLYTAASVAEIFICAWGRHGGLLNRSAIVLQELRRRGVGLHYLFLTKEPWHPLFLPYALRPIPWA